MQRASVARMTPTVNISDFVILSFFLFFIFLVFSQKLRRRVTRNIEKKSTWHYTIRLNLSAKWRTSLCVFSSLWVLVSVALTRHDKAPTDASFNTGKRRERVELEDLFREMGRSIGTR